MDKLHQILALFIITFVIGCEQPLPTEVKPTPTPYNDPKGTLIINSVPEGAKFDDWQVNYSGTYIPRLEGFTPCTIDWWPGYKALTLSKPGYNDKIITFTLCEDETTRVTVVLQKK